jgi:glyoxylate carboligase
MTDAAGLLIERLVDWGVDTIFGLPGDGINGVVEALRKNQDRIRFVQTRHEEAAAFAACGYAKVSGSLTLHFIVNALWGRHMTKTLPNSRAVLPWRERAFLTSRCQRAFKSKRGPSGRHKNSVTEAIG